MNDIINSKIWQGIVEKLTKQNFTIATMESCTGGAIVNEITCISGASQVLKESYVTYSNEAKIKQGVSNHIIEKYTVYSKETAIEMARVVKKIANSNLAIGVTGQIGRIDPNNRVDKLNYVWYSIINNKNDVIVKEIKVPNDDRKIQKQYILDCIAEDLAEAIDVN